MFQGSCGEQSCVCVSLPRSRSREGILCHPPRSLSLQGVALRGLSVCSLGRAVRVVCGRTGIVSSEMGEELPRSLSAVFSSNRQYPFRLLFYRAATGQAQEAGNLEEVREKRVLGRSRLAVFSFSCLNPLAQDTRIVSLHLTT